jgi:hypothetical protein
MKVISIDSLKIPNIVDEYQETFFPHKATR